MKKFLQGLSFFYSSLVPVFFNVPFLLILFLLPASWGAGASELAIPSLRGPLMDEAGILSQSAETQLENMLWAVHQRRKVQLQVLTLKDLGELSIEEASIKIADKWKLGTEGKDNGVLFLIVPSARKMRIEVGQGLEGDLPDIYAKRIIADRVSPLFRKGKFDEGVAAGILGVLEKVDPDFDVKSFLDKKYLSQHKKGLSLPLDMNVILFLLLVFIVAIVSIVQKIMSLFGYAPRSWHSSGWGGGGGGSWGAGGGFSGGGGGGSSWGGGGGGFSGGGASGDW